MSKSLKKLIDINRLREFKNKLPVFESWPAGVIIPFAGNVIPEGFLVCNGAAVSRVTYANLFEAIGTLYGAGDGSTTFNLPDVRDRVLQGASSTHAVGTSIVAGLPNIEGFVANGGGFFTYLGAGGAFSVSNGGSAGISQPGSSLYANFSFSARTSNSTYGNSGTVQPPAVSTYTLIKI